MHEFLHACVEFVIAHKNRPKSRPMQSFFVAYYIAPLTLDGTETLLEPELAIITPAAAAAPG
jgi:hypothetical protein